jgi:hypothetical protein
MHNSPIMRFIPLLVAGLLWAAVDASAAQAPPAANPGSVRVTVRDATGLPVAGATVTLTSPAGPALTSDTTNRGEAVFERVPAGAYDARIESLGFTPLDRPSVVVRNGRRTDLGVELQIAGIEEQVEVVPEPADEPFTTALTAEQIQSLPDDPTELAQVLEQLVGSDLDIRVNGFAGGELPPGGRISEVRIRWDGGANGRGEGPRVEIRTQPGSDGWRNRVNFGLRDERLNARNAYSRERASGQTRQYGWTISGPLVPNRTGMSLTIDRSESFEQQAIRAARPEGVFSALVPQPARRVGVAAEVEHALNPSQELRLDLRVNDNDQQNLGVSEFDLPERAYSRDQGDGRLRAGYRGTFRQRYVNDLRLQFGWRTSDTRSVSDATAIRVLDAFTSGGAQLHGGSRSREIEIEDELEFTLGRAHQITAGFTINGTSYHADDQRNANGTFTFASLEAFGAGVPTTFTQRVGTPTIDYSMLQFGWSVQDNYRVHRTLMLNLGMRHDLQTHLDDAANLSPRLGFNWTPFGNRRTAVRVSAGRFYQFLDSSLYEQTLRVDGRQQRDLVISNPGYPDPYSQGVPLAQRPASIIRLGPGLVMPSTWRLSVGLDQPLTSWARLRTTYARRTGHDLFRSRDMNAPVGGVRPNLALGSITELESTGRSRTHSLETRLSVTYQPTRLTGTVTYTLGEAMDDSDGALNLPPDSSNLLAEWGPSRQDIRHRLRGSVNTNLWAGFRLDAGLRAQSASPYTITTGLDANGDGEHNERPAGLGRNSARGVSSTSLDMGLTWSRPLRPAPAAGVARAVQGGPQGRGGGGGQNQGQGERGGRGAANVPRLEIFARATNVLNAVNPQRFGGVVTSPFFGLPTSAAAARRVNAGIRVMF